jgi:hypothetical protein
MITRNSGCVDFSSLLGVADAVGKGAGEAPGVVDCGCWRPPDKPGQQSSIVLTITSLLK